MLRFLLRRNGYSRNFSLFVLALLLALLLWWAVAIADGPRRTRSNPVPRKPAKRPRGNRVRLAPGSDLASVGELILVDEEEAVAAPVDDQDDDWPDIIDA
jgi:hypothetical protein